MPPTKRSRARIRDELFGFVGDPANRTRIKPEYVGALYGLDPTRARRELPYFVAAELYPLDEAPASLEDLDSRGADELLTYADAPCHLLAGEVIVIDAEGKESSCWRGLCSFLPSLEGKTYALVCGDRARRGGRTTLLATRTEDARLLLRTGRMAARPRRHAKSRC